MKIINKLRSFSKNTLPYFLGHELWSDHRFTPFLRFIRLQLFFLMGETKVCLPWIDDLLLPIERGDSGLTGNYYLGLDEFKDMAFMLHLLRENDKFVDVGSNLGSYSLLACGVTNAQTIAFEPVPGTFKRLQKNIQINNLTDRLTILMKALTNQGEMPVNGYMPFSCDRGTMNSFVDSDYKGKIVEVQVSTLDQELIHSIPVLMKIDTEGFEESVLKGAVNLLADHALKAIIIEGQTSAVNQILLSAGFTDFSYDPVRRKLIPIYKYTPNRIWVRAEYLQEVSQRLATAPYRTVYGQSF